MGDVESEQPQEDFEVEIVDLDELASTPGSSNSAHKRLLRPSQPLRFLARRRRLQLGITTSVVVLVVLMLLASTAPVREVVGSLLPGLTPTPSPAGLQTDLFYFKASPSWGYLTIDGHVVSPLPRMSVDRPLRLPPGQHVLVWHAAPFLAQRCAITVPTKPGVDSCRFDPPLEVGNGLFASIITFSESLNTLSTTQRALLIQAVQAELGTMQYSEMVQPGEPYALSYVIADVGHNPCRLTLPVVLCYAIAAQPLKATLSFQLDMNASQDALCTASGACSHCRLFCDAADIVGPMWYSMSAAAEWNVVVVVRPLWQFTTLDGRVIAHDQADTFIAGQGNDYFVMLNTVWENLGWSISPPSANLQSLFGDPVCDSAENDTQVLQINSDALIQTQSPRTDLGAGCLVTIKPGLLSSLTPSPSSEVAYCLHRFGVLLAVNNLAHRLWPFLPVADAYEKRLAQQLAAET